LNELEKSQYFKVVAAATWKFKKIFIFFKFQAAAKFFWEISTKSPGLTW